MTREQQIEQEAHDLWQAMNEGAPPCGLRGSDLIDALLRGLDAPRYERLHSPFLRDSQIHRPR